MERCILLWCINCYDWLCIYICFQAKFRHQPYAVVGHCHEYYHIKIHSLHSWYLWLLTWWCYIANSNICHWSEVVRPCVDQSTGKAVFLDWSSYQYYDLMSLIWTGNRYSNISFSKLRSLNVVLWQKFGGFCWKLILWFLLGWN